MSSTSAQTQILTALPPQSVRYGEVQNPAVREQQPCQGEFHTTATSAQGLGGRGRGEGQLPASNYTLLMLCSSQLENMTPVSYPSCVFIGYCEIKRTSRYLDL